MLNKFIDWIMLCSVPNPYDATWVQIAKVIICYIARLFVFLVIVFALSYAGVNIINYAI